MLHEQPFQDVVPDLAEQLIAALKAIGRADLADQFAKVRLRHFTYDATVNAGYLYVTESRSLNSTEQSVIRATHGESVVLDELPGTVVVDVDNFGRIQGVELLGHADLFRRLASAA